MNSVEELEKDCLGYAGLVYEHVLGEEKYTFVEDVRNPHSCTILIKGPADYSLAQIKVVFEKSGNPPCSQAAALDRKLPAPCKQQHRAGCETRETRGLLAPAHLLTDQV